MKYILYQAYGKDEIVHEAIFSILSLLRFGPLTNDVRIIIYTDKQDLVEEHLNGLEGLIYEPLTEEMIRQWRGDIDFVHRVKIKVLQHFFQHYDGLLLYLDSDTYFLSNPIPLFDPISAGKILMHLPEGKISSRKNPIFKKMYRFLKGNTFTLAGQSFHMLLDTEMWNAGVIGINKGYAPLLDDVLALTDQMYSRYQKHVMEQLAFSFILNRAHPLTATDDIIFHYWYFKEFRENIGQFLEKHRGEKLLEKAAKTEEIAPYKLKPAPEEKKSFWQKIFG